MSGAFVNNDTPKRFTPKASKAYAEGALNRIFGGTLGSDLMTNGDLSSGSGWQPRSWTITGNQAVIDGSQTQIQDTIDNDVAVNVGSGIVGIPITGHSFAKQTIVTISGTTNYDGDHVITAVSTNQINIAATYVAETFSGSETVVSDEHKISQNVTGLTTRRKYQLTVVIDEFNAGSARIQLEDSNFPIFEAGTYVIDYVRNGTTCLIGVTCDNDFDGAIGSFSFNLRSFALSDNPYDNDGSENEGEWDSGWNAVEALEENTISITDLPHLSLAGHYVPEKG